MMLAVLGTVIALAVTFGLVRLTVRVFEAPASSGEPTAGATSPQEEGQVSTATPVPDGQGRFAAAPSASASASPSASSAGKTESSGGNSACPRFPRFPDENCTGYKHTGVKLRDCANNVTKSNIKLDGCRFTNGLTIEGKNVTITRSLVKGKVGGTYKTDWSLVGLKLIDVEIDGGGKVDPNGEAAIGNDDYTCIRCHIHGTGRGANMRKNVHIEDSYLHGWVYVDGAHQTAIGSNGGSNYKIIHNNLVCDSEGCSAALSLYGDFEPIKNALIERNLFNTNGGYCTYGGSTSAKPFPIGTDIRYVNNLFGKKYGPKCGYYGPVATFEFHQGNVWSGNSWQDGSGPVKPQS
ncbi:hypothetical protein ACTMTJ_22925 [Phytohabitans sp. LJ34]|uniref:hypothetical protein n=1 Tax=Phytohabitans sp. LJ34 TaxID=3452217 RepID=UPI003F8B1970